MGIPTYSSGDPLLDFFYILFNGISEVPLLSSPVTGIFILAGVLIASRKAGIMMVAAGLIGAGTALLLGADYGLVTFGLFGYNSILTGMAFWSGPFVKANRVTLTISIFGAIITAVAWMAFAHFMGDIFNTDEKGGIANSVAIPGFTSSFIFTTWAMMYASKRYGHDVWPEVPQSAKEDKIPGSDNPLQVKPENFKWTAKEFIIATFKGVSQVTFVENWKTGVFWVVGLTLTFELAPLIAGVQDRPWFTNGYTAQWNEYSPLYLAGVMAFIGSAIGAALSILMKLPTQETRIGLHGFNQGTSYDRINQLCASYTAVILTGCSCNGSLFGDSNACTPKVLRSMGITCTYWAICIYCLGLANCYFRILKHTRRDRLV